MASFRADPETVKRALRINYLGARSDQTSKMIDGFAALLGHFQSPIIDVHNLIQETANYVHRQFRLRWAMVGLRGNDGKYRYEVMSGMRPEAWESQRARTYKKEDFALAVEGVYNAGEISRLTRVYLEEENPLAQEDTTVVNRPFLLKSNRKSPEDSLEADFVDTLILNNNNDLLGWIEYSGTVTGKLPDAMTIRYVELISAILAAAISTQHHGSYHG